MNRTNNWTGWISELSKTRQGIAVEMQGHGRTADIERDFFSYESLADDVAALLDHLKIPSADLIGYSMGGGVAMRCAIRHPEKVRKVVSISAVFRQDGWVKGALEMFPKLTAESFKGSPIDTRTQPESLKMPSRSVSNTYSRGLREVREVKPKADLGNPGCKTLQAP